MYAGMAQCGINKQSGFGRSSFCQTSAQLFGKKAPKPNPTRLGSSKQKSLPSGKVATWPPNLVGPGIKNFSQTSLGLVAITHIKTQPRWVFDGGQPNLVGLGGHSARDWVWWLSSTYAYRLKAYTLEGNWCKCRLASEAPALSQSCYEVHFPFYELRGYQPYSYTSNTGTNQLNIMLRNQKSSQAQLLRCTDDVNVF